MATRIDRRFAKLRDEGRAGLVAYVMAGDPDLETAWEIFRGLPEAGADVIELGMCFTDPMADGPVIQVAGQRALKSGMTLRKTLAMVKRFRETDDDTPVVLMGYYNPIYAYGNEAFLRDARDAGLDGLIIVDLPPEEDVELCLPTMKAGLNWVRLATPTTDDKRLPAVVGNASGFIYYVSITGITGAKGAEAAVVAKAVKRLNAKTDLPIVVGFGVKTPQDAAAIARVADGVAVGTAFCQTVADGLDGNGKAKPDCAANVLALARALGEGVRGARR